MYRFALFVFVTLATPLTAQEAPAGHDGHAMQGATTEATSLYAEANARMHSAMAVETTGDVDVDFIRGMIPHHEGAVEMATIVLAHGEDAEVRKLAEAVIATQEAEIAWMKEWLASKGY